MTFYKLEDRIAETGRIDEYLDVFARLQEPTATVLRYTLDIAVALEETGLQHQYVVHGGYASLAHLMGIFGEKIALVWRGSQDIDMAGTERVLSTLKKYYEVTNDQPSPNLPNKRTVKLKTRTTPPEEEVKIDFSMYDQPLNVTTRTFFGITLPVRAPFALLQSKLYCPPEDKQTIDMTNLLYVLEHEGMQPQEIVRQLKQEELRRFQQVVYNGPLMTGNQRMALSPSIGFSNNLKLALRGRGANLVTRR
jgi:hypothetical protein